MIAGDGDVVAGAALVNESAVTGESAPVIRESGGDRSAVTGGTTVISSQHHRQDHRQSRRDLPGPDDLPDRGGQAAQDPQRDRPGGAR